MHRLFQTSIETADILFIVLDERGSIRQFNRFASELTGYTADEVDGENWFDLFVPQDKRADMRLLFSNIFEKSTNDWGTENLIIDKDASSHLIRWNNTLFTDNSTGERSLISIGEDITALSDALHRAKQDERRYRTLVDNLPHYIFHKDPDSNYLSCNASYANDLGKSPEEVVGTNDLEYFPYEHATKYRKDDARIINEKRRVDMTETYIEHSTGERLTVKTVKTPIYDDNGDSEGLIGIFWDITEEVESKRQLEETREILAHAESVMHTGSWKLDIKRDQLVWSDETYKILEIDKVDFTPSYEAFLAIIHPDDYDAVNLAYQDSLISKEPYEIEHRIIMKDGRVKSVLEQCHTSFSDKGEPLVSIGTMQDITEKKQVDLKIIKQAALLRSVIDATPDLIYYKDYNEYDGIYMGCNQAFEALIDCDENELIGQNDIEMFGTDLGTFYRARDKEMLASGETKIDEEWVIYPDGRRILLQTIRTPLIGLDDTIRGLIGVSRDITARWEAEQQIRRQSETLQYQAQHDELTGLPNRALLNDRLDKAIAKANRSGGQFAVLFIDLDQFKQINDSFGHAKGDMVLKDVALRLNRLIREEDTLSRLGGDEFVIIIEQLHRLRHASVMAEKIILALREPISDRQNDLYLTSSIGISTFPQDGRNSQDLMKNADAAMYKAKEQGRNNYQFYSAEMTKIAYERVMMESDLRRALKKHELRLFYQPKIDLTHNRIEGLEVLLRWQHPRHGLILPAAFIPIAEESGLIIELGEYVLKQAIIQLKIWQDTAIDVGHIAINISTKQLQQADFFERFIMIIEEHDCKPESIWLEITEDYITQDPDHHIPVLKKFIDYGVKIAIDDFGSHYSSLSFLRQLPIDQLKLSQTFIHDIEDDLSMTKAIIAMANSLRVDVIAKGVETDEQSQSLKDQGCKEVQGFLYGRPANALATEKLISSQAYA